MAQAGQVLVNPVSGERFTFLKTAADTDGKLLQFDLDLSPEGRVPGAHVHPLQEERFEVLEGKMKFRKGFKTAVAGAGETVVVPPGTVHKFKNAGEAAARVRVEVRPALNMQGLFESVASLAEDGRTNAAGMPRPLDLALFMQEFEAEVRAPFVPAALVRAFMAPLASLARRRGLDARYRPARRAPASRTDSRRPPTRTSARRASRRTRTRTGREAA